MSDVLAVRILTSTDVLAEVNADQLTTPIIADDFISIAADSKVPVAISALAPLARAKLNNKMPKIINFL